MLGLESRKCSYFPLAFETRAWLLVGTILMLIMPW